jgi:hypothetical protein
MGGHDGPEYPEKKSKLQKRVLKILRFEDPYIRASIPPFQHVQTTRQPSQVGVSH